MPSVDPHAKFLVQLLAGTAANVPQSESWTWERFIKAASREALVPALYSLIKKPGLWEHIPLNVRDFSFAAKELNRKRNSEIFDRVHIIASALNKVGVEPVLLKGSAYLLTGVYLDHADRFLADIDLLVDKENIPASLEVLEQLDYSFERVHPIDHETNHTYAVLSRSDAMSVDLHQIVGLGASSLILPTRDVFRNSHVIDMNGARVRLPSPADLAIHHVLHSQVHELYRDRVWTPLRSLYDLSLIQKRFESQIDWNEISQRFQRYRLDGDLALYLKLAERTVGFNLPIELRLSLKVRLRWWHRQLLRRLPQARFVDPFWFYSAGIEPRTRRLQSILNQPGGLRYLLKKLFTIDFFLRLKADLS